LSYDAPEGCPAAEWVLERVARYLRRDVERREDAALVADVSIELAESGEFIAELALQSADGHRDRELRDLDCVLVGDAVAFVVALAIDPTVRAGDAPLTSSERERGARGEGARSDVGSARAPATETPTQGRRDEATDSVSPKDETEPEPRAPEREAAATGPPLQIGSAFGVTVGAASQPLPELSPDAALYAALRIGQVARVELGFGYSLPQSKPAPNDTHVAAQFDHFTASLASCAMPRLGSTELGGCLRIYAGIVRGHGTEFSAGRNATPPYVALSLGPAWMQPIGQRFALRLELAPSLALVRPRFTMGEGVSKQVVHEPEKIGFLGALGGELRFD
jgi:hypothetical protein